MSQCHKCLHKISITDIIICKCRCGYIYCKKHRLEHNCNFDYHADYTKHHKLEKFQEKKIDKI
jgi:uncharacterized Fe-S cluster-containing radical SAM superfamily protein